MQGFCWDNPITFYLSVIAVRDLLFKQKAYNIIKRADITFGLGRENISWQLCRNLTINLIPRLA